MTHFRSMSVFLVSVLLLLTSINGFQLNSRTSIKGFQNSVTSSKKNVLSNVPRGNTQLNMDATLIPMLVGATGLIFAVFSFDNKIDLTDSGMAKAKAIRYNARKEKGEIPSKEVLANADPYRWFAEEDEEVDILTPKKKKGGGCG